MMKRKLISIAQFSYIAIISFFLVGRLASDQSFSISAALIAVAVTCLAFYIAGITNSSTKDYESNEPKWSLLFIRLSTFSLLISVSLYTLELYIHFRWAKQLIIAFMVIAAYLGVASKMSKWIPKSEDN